LGGVFVRVAVVGVRVVGGRVDGARIPPGGVGVTGAELERRSMVDADTLRCLGLNPDESWQAHKQAMGEEAAG
jgi:hypothetical protein